MSETIIWDEKYPMPNASEALARYNKFCEATAKVVTDKSNFSERVKKVHDAYNT